LARIFARNRDIAKVKNYLEDLHDKKYVVSLQELEKYEELRPLLELPEVKAIWQK
jgi:hypothetical protein